MDELKEKLAALGLDDEQVAGAIEVFTDFLKSKVPSGMEGMLDAFMQSGAPQIGPDTLDRLKGLF
jgi:hypothetical protein